MPPVARAAPLVLLVLAAAAAVLSVLVIVAPLRSGLRATPMFSALAAQPATATAMCPVVVLTTLARVVPPPPPAVRR